MDISTAIDQWQTLLGSQQVVLGASVHQAYGADTSGFERRVPAALRIQDTALLPDVMRIAHACRVPVYPISTGHNWGYGTALPVKDDCVILDLGGLRKVLHFDAELGVVTLEPGVTQGMLAEFLEAGGHPFLVPVTGAGPTCSLLANALERGYGVTPHVDHFGAVTDIEAVLADGTLYRTALREAGGEDLARLFKWGLGPYGTGLFTQSGFGVVTRMTIVLARRPECVKLCLFSLQDDALLEQAVLRIRTILGRVGSTIGGINLMNQHRVLSMTAPYPVGSIGPDGLIPAAVLKSMGKQYQVFPWTGFGTLYGSRRMVAAAQQEIKSALGGIATRLMFVSSERARHLAALTSFIPGKIGKGLQGMTATLAKSMELVAGKPNETAMPLAYWRNSQPQKGPFKDPALDGCGLIWYAPLVPMRPSDVRSYVEMVKATTPKYGLEPLITLTTLSERLFDSTVPLVFDRDNSKAVSDAAACYGDLLTSGRNQGCFPYRIDVNAMDTVMDMQPHARAFNRRLLNGLDPYDILAPGRYR